MNHLKSVNMTYFQHLKQTLYFFAIFQKLSIVAVIHGVFPNLLTSVISKTVRKLDKDFRIREAKLKCCNGDCSCH